MPTRLTGMDAIWLNIETRAAHMHVGGAIVLDPSTTRKGGLTREGLTGYLAERLHLAAPLRRRLSTVPCNLDFPAWIEDPDFDLDRHVRAAVLPALPRRGGVQYDRAADVHVRGARLDVQPDGIHPGETCGHAADPRLVFARLSPCPRRPERCRQTG